MNETVREICRPAHSVAGEFDGGRQMTAAVIGATAALRRHDGVCNAGAGPGLYPIDAEGPHDLPSLIGKSPGIALVSEEG